MGVPQGRGSVPPPGHSPGNATQGLGVPTDGALTMAHTVPIFRGETEARRGWPMWAEAAPQEWLWGGSCSPPSLRGSLSQRGVRAQGGEAPAVPTPTRLGRGDHPALERRPMRGHGRVTSPSRGHDRSPAAAPATPGSWSHQAQAGVPSSCLECQSVPRGAVRGGCQGRRWPLGSRLKMDILFVTIKTSDFSFINF